MRKYKVGLIGTGLQANRRLSSIAEHPLTTLATIAGLNMDKATHMAKLAGAKSCSCWKEVIQDDKIDIIVICTPPDMHFPIAKVALKAKKHVLCEKPLTRSSSDALKLVSLARKNKVVFKCGFNHRHHPAMQHVYQIVKDQTLGYPITGRAVYGICGREDCTTEWRSDPKVASGGQLMEQGIHAIDLFRWFIGDFDSVSANVATLVFPIQPLEDTASVLLRKNNGVAVTIHSSITQWRNRFRFELYFSQGYIEIMGLGGSYDMQKLHIGKRDPNAPFAEQVIDYRGSDKSWRAEWKHFLEGIEQGTELLGSGIDGVEASRIVEAAYVSSKEERFIKLKDFTL